MSTPAGWYPDPNDSTQLRYWDGSAWTENRSPRSSTPTQVGARPTAPTGKWYFIITIATAGLFAAVPFFHAASRLDRPKLRKVGAQFAAGSVVGGALIGFAPTDDTGQPTGLLANVGVTIMLAIIVVATGLQIGLRREVYGSPAAAQSPTPNARAMARIDEARRKRIEARALALKDPMMARELGIGRPRSTRDFDDGGLLELNSATEDELSQMCGLPRDVAEQVVSTRTTLGRFLTVEDAIVYGQVSEEYAPALRERGLIIDVP